MLKDGAILTDAGSVKQAVIRDLQPYVPRGVHFVPGHPVAGTEHSGPESGFAELFRDRWCILTPLPDTDAEALARLTGLWEQAGMRVVTMDPEHHDKVLAMTSHLPHVIAYTIVGTATDLEDSLKSEVIKFSAGGFRDFTRIAASDPVMWRDIFLNNREAVLEIVQRFTEDLTALQRAIRWGEGDKLQELFTRTRAIRRSIIEAKQAGEGWPRLFPGDTGHPAELCRSEEHLSVLDREYSPDLRFAVRSGLGEQRQRDAREPGIGGSHLPVLHERRQNLIVSLDRSGEAAGRLELLVEGNRPGRRRMEGTPFQAQIV